MSRHNKPYEGFFITVEGGEGAGKTTFASSLATQLQREGRRCLQTREPGGTPLAERLRELLLHPPEQITISIRSELLLFLAARAQHIDEILLPALRGGQLVICERFNDSTIAYQGYARHLGMETIEQLCHLVCEGVEPDLTFFLDIAPEKGLRRHLKDPERSLDRLELEQLQFHQEVRQGYLHLADKHRDRIVVLDGELAPALLVQQALDLIHASH